MDTDANANTNADGSTIALRELCSGQLKMENEGRILVFFHTIYLAPLKCIENLKTLAIIGVENSVTKSFIAEKEKLTNKGNDKQQHAYSLLHNTTSHTQYLYQIS